VADGQVARTGRRYKKTGSRYKQTGSKICTDSQQIPTDSQHIQTDRQRLTRDSLPETASLVKRGETEEKETTGGTQADRDGRRGRYQ